MANCSCESGLAGQWDLTVLGHFLAELTHVTCSLYVTSQSVGSSNLNEVEVSRWDRFSVVIR